VEEDLRDQVTNYFKESNNILSKVLAVFEEVSYLPENFYSEL